MPWRRVNELCVNDRAYRVWVSEMMLQQTQVATVVAYYNKWMKRWPTVKDLANATCEEVNEMWAGLGYYSRGRRLLEGAQKVMRDFNGKIPDTSHQLRTLPGVGQYTAAAIASIVFNEPCGVVDGNVVRVLSRMRSIGSDTSQQKTIQHFWKVADNIVDHEKPGDFNQSLMELGAIVCTPKTPLCSTCPVKSCCRAVETATTCPNDSTDIEALDFKSDCELCLPVEKWQPSVGVMNYPQKSAKIKVQEEQFAVAIVRCRLHYILTQRPNQGLLAGMWQFPSVSVDSSSSERTMKESLSSCLLLHLNVGGISPASLDKIGQIKHAFSHRHHVYHVFKAEISDKSCLGDEMPQLMEAKWVSAEELLQSAISTGVKKIFQLFQSSLKAKPNRKRLRSVKLTSSSAKIRQTTLDEVCRKA
ncbi:adenine DNA glycosylase-like [Corticium candelabrum]|uniref:adenine DNA glycosylase-like n=1 Tax=Corticium candelabrum TaxID=121492 RepID=UPI002E2578D3|nr:adenine DNA glycosylase-like [Corticium candelabrum]